MYTVLISLALVACALAQTQQTNSIRYQLQSQQMSGGAFGNGFSTSGGHALVTFNAGRDNCDTPSLESPCGWGFQRSVEYAKATSQSSSTAYSPGQRNAFRLNKISANAGFWAGNRATLNDNLVDLSTLEADTRYEYFHNSNRKTTTGPTGTHGVFLNSADADENNVYSFNSGVIFNDCFRIFTQSGFPNSYDFVAQGTFNNAPSGVSFGNSIIYGFWGEAVIGTIAEGNAEAYYEGTAYTTRPGGLTGDTDLNNELTALGRDTTTPGMYSSFSTPTNFPSGNDAAPIWPLAYQPAGSFNDGGGFNNDRVVQVCYVDGTSCTFAPVARLTSVACSGFTYFA